MDVTQELLKDITVTAEAVITAVLAHRQNAAAVAAADATVGRPTNLEVLSHGQALDQPSWSYR